MLRTLVGLKRKPTIIGVAPGQRVVTTVHYPGRGDLFGAIPTLAVRVDGRVVSGVSVEGWPKHRVARLGRMAARLSPEVLQGVEE